MHGDDKAFLEACGDPGRLEVAMRGWHRMRRLSFIAAVLFLVLALLALLVRLGSLCGLFAAVSAINYAGAASADMKIKLGLLARRQGGGRDASAPPDSPASTAG